jgi:hypothetical protein
VRAALVLATGGDGRFGHGAAGAAGRFGVGLVVR